MCWESLSHSKWCSCTSSQFLEVWERFSLYIKKIIEIIIINALTVIFFLLFFCLGGGGDSDFHEHESANYITTRYEVFDARVDFSTLCAVSIYKHTIFQFIILYTNYFSWGELKSLLPYAINFDSIVTSITTRGLFLSANIFCMILCESIIIRCNRIAHYCVKVLYAIRDRFPWLYKDI